MKQLKEEYKNQVMGNAKLRYLNTNEITDEMIPFLTKQGFGFLFEDVEVIEDLFTYVPKKKKKDDSSK